MMHQKEPLFDGKLNCNECVLSSLYILVFSMSYNMQQQIENNKIELTEIKTTETALINYNVETNLISKSDNYTLKDKHHHHQYNQMNSMNHKNAISRNIYGCANTNLYANYINGIVTVSYTMKSFCPTTSNMPNICNIDCTSFHSCDNTQFGIPQNQYNGLNLFCNCQGADFHCDIGAGLTELPYDNGTSYFKCVTYSCYAIYEGNIPCLSNVPCHVDCSSKSSEIIILMQQKQQHYVLNTMV